MPQKQVQLNIDDLEVVKDNPDYIKIQTDEIVKKIKELKNAGGLEGGVGIGVVW